MASGHKNYGSLRSIGLLCCLWGVQSTSPLYIISQKQQLTANFQKFVKLTFSLSFEFKMSKKKCFVCGNINKPLFEIPSNPQIRTKWFEALDGVIGNLKQKHVAQK
jgi:hypothetical protein